VDHAFRHFVEGAIAAGGENQVRAARDLVPCQGSRGARAGGGTARDVVPVPFEDLGGVRNQGAALPSQLARARVIDQDGVAIIGDGEFSRFLVKL